MPTSSRSTCRLPRIPGGVADVEREQRWLPWLARSLPVAIPVVLGAGAPAEGFPWPWSVCEWLDGDNPVVGHIADPRALAADLAGFVAALQRVDPAGAPPSAREMPLSTRDAATRAALGELHGVIDIDAATAAWDAALAVPEWSGPPTWSHADLMPATSWSTAAGSPA
jgi:aminoglycoside phosphotransferase (APT) family kinase protein